MTGERFLVTGALGCIGTWVVRELVTKHAYGTFKIQGFEQPAMRVKAHHYRFALHGKVEALLDLSILAYDYTHLHSACLRGIFIVGGIIRCWECKSQVNRGHEARRKIIHLLCLFDLYFCH